MSVYTSISVKTLEKFLFQYSLGELINFTGIIAGIENTNFTVKTSQGAFILTIFEKKTVKELSIIFKYLNHLTVNNFPSPIPQASKNGGLINMLEGKPAAFFNRLPGCAINSPSIAQCEEIGGYLAKLHLYSKDYGVHNKKLEKLINMQSAFNRIKPYLTQEDCNLLHSELNFQLSNFPKGLPKGIIHSDLFKDNVLFNQGKISGIVDFYDASTDYFIFDIAVACNDWCVEKTSINHCKLTALIHGYQKVRPLIKNEKCNLSIFFRLAALRFWISRLEHQLYPKSGELTLEKNPNIFRQLLEHHKTNAFKLI